MSFYIDHILHMGIEFHTVRYKVFNNCMITVSFHIKIVKIHYTLILYIFQVLYKDIQRIIVRLYIHLIVN